MKARSIRILAFAILALCAPLWIGPSGAFQHADLAPRTVRSNVVADNAAYVAITSSACTIPAIGGGTCAFTITNKATEAMTYTVAKTSDPESLVTGSSLSQTGSRAVGESTTLTATIRTCLGCSGQKTILWRVTATSAEDTFAIRSNYPMTFTYV